jgi:hypothetical protein
MKLSQRYIEKITKGSQINILRLILASPRKTARDDMPPLTPIDFISSGLSMATCKSIKKNSIFYLLGDHSRGMEECA